MPSLRYRAKRTLVFLSRLSYLGGNRIQSPFVYNFANEVINNRTPYYAYEDLRAELRALSLRERKVAKLLFRLSNRIQPERIILPLSLCQFSPFLKAGCQKAEFSTAPDLAHTTLQVEESPTRLRPLKEGSIFVILGIRKSREAKREWQILTEQSWASISLDLYHLGLLIERNSISKQHHKINF